MRRAIRIDPSQGIVDVFGWFFLALKICGLSEHTENSDEVSDEVSDKVSDNEGTDNPIMSSLLVPEDDQTQSGLWISYVHQYNNNGSALSFRDPTDLQGEGESSEYKPSSVIPICLSSLTVSNGSSVKSVTDCYDHDWGGRKLTNDEGSHEQAVNNDSQGEEEEDDSSHSLPGYFSPRSVLDGAHFQMDDIDNDGPMRMIGSP